MNATDDFIATDVWNLDRSPALAGHA
jgi:hypothetical protein